MLACQVCSQPNPDGAVYCSFCGVELTRPRSSTVQGAPLESAFPSPQPPPRQPSVPPGPIMPSSLLRAGQVVDGKYVIESVIGEGGMGIVYLARDQNTDARVVVKAIRAEMAHQPELRERIRAEGRAMAHIDHPNVVRLNAVVIEQGGLFLVMQYVDGKSLDKIIEEHVAARSPLPFETAIALWRQVCAGVGAAHLEGVVHRDIKPANVLVRAKDNVAKVTDFGIAKAEDDAKAGRGRTKGIIGSLWYMAPEQVTGQRDLDKRVDIYALGIVLYELLVGQVPFDAPGDVAVMRMHVETPLPSVSAQRHDVPLSIDALLARACAKSRDDRFSSCEELVLALDKALAPQPQISTVPGFPLVSPDAIAGFSPAATIPAYPPIPPSPISAHSRSTTADDAPPLGHLTHAGSPPAPRSKAPWIAAGALLLGAAAGLYAGVFSPDGEKSEESTSAPTASNTPAPSAPSAVPAETAAAPEPVTLETLKGRWVSDTQRHYNAVVSGSALEFRIIDPKEFEGQTYEVNESRFTLRPIEGKGYFLVEDKIRPVPPTGTTYAATARGTCQEVWREVKGQKLEARYAEGKLSVDLVKLSPPKSLFTISNNKVTSCSPMQKAPTALIESTLTRDEK